MATPELYKLDVGDSYPSNCFPIRSFFHQRKEGAGHWLVVHRASVENRYRLSPISKSGGCKITSNSIVSESTRVEELPGNILDGHLLMTLHCVDKPSDLCSVDISEQRLNSVKPEEFVDFNNVAYINASDNFLSIEPFGAFPSLRELELSLNRLCNVTLNPDAFPHLEMLDLSYNNLSPDDIMSIGLLPRLKVLHLTGNRLQALPPDMAAPCCDPSQLAVHDAGLRFRVLEVLMLDDNKLSSGVFSSLANLKRLQHLNLQGNDISEVPYLQQKVFNNQQSEEQELGIYPDSAVVGYGTKEATERIHALSDDSKHKSENIKNNSEEELKNNSQSHVSLDTVEGLPGAVRLPLPELHFLNMADNKIVEEEALLAVALFPMLSEIVIHSNPLTTQKSGDPPVLTYFLQERLGIKISRKKTAGVVKPPLILSIDSKRKVKTNSLKVPLLMAAPSSPSGDGGPLEEREEADGGLWTSPPSQRSEPTERSDEEAFTGKTDGSVATDGAVESTDETFQHGESCFVTQVTELSDSDHHPLLDRTEDLENKDMDAIPEKFKGYELLLDADKVEPVGIQRTVGMLERTLQNLLVYRDSQPKHCLQKAYIETQNKTGKLAPMVPRRQRGERVQEMLLTIKERKTITKVPLNDVLKGKDVYKEEYEEALSLLRDMRKKYKGVHMKAVEQATRMESERTSNPHVQ